MIILAFIFVVSLTNILMILYRYKKSEKIYDDAADRYVAASNDADTAGASGEKSSDEDAETAPITIDFDELKKVNPDIVGWIYCPDSVINYPLLKGSDNDYYLHHAYDGTSSSSGAIFIDAENADDFEDSNTIIYGHHMKNGSMFASLSKWEEQDYYEKHSVMWILTPEQDYKIILFSGYTTSAYSDTYTIFHEPGEDFTQYIMKCAGYSDFAIPETKLYENSKYVLLSTCEYSFDDARYVLHGMMVPIQ
jgi:sortase B